MACEYEPDLVTNSAITKKKEIKKCYCIEQAYGLWSAFLSSGIIDGATLPQGSSFIILVFIVCDCVWAISCYSSVLIIFRPKNITV